MQQGFSQFTDIHPAVRLLHVALDPGWVMFDCRFVLNVKGGSFAPINIAEPRWSVPSYHSQTRMMLFHIGNVVRVQQ